MVHSRRFELSLVLCYFVLVFFSPFSITITSLGEERANLSAFRTFVRFVLIWFCLFPLPLGVWEGLRFVIVALPGLFSYLFWYDNRCDYPISLDGTTTITDYIRIFNSLEVTLSPLWWHSVYRDFMCYWQIFFCVAQF